MRWPKSLEALGGEKPLLWVNFRVKGQFEGCGGDGVPCSTVSIRIPSLSNSVPEVHVRLKGKIGSGKKTPIAAVIGVEYIRVTAT
jgi:hypothetical protein